MSDIEDLIDSGRAFRGDPIQNSEFITELADALAAERDRADRAEATLAEAWDQGYDAASADWENGGPGNPNPYRTEATA